LSPVFRQNGKRSRPDVTKANDAQPYFCHNPL
jgi:hypothetical protein